MFLSVKKNYLSFAARLRREGNYVIIISMKSELAALYGKRVCVAVSGGRDSMALLHYLDAVKDERKIKLTAMNCDHCMREKSARDSAFVAEYCRNNDIPLLFYSAGELTLGTEEEARDWRRKCYFKAVKGVDGNGVKITDGADLIATAHHLDDNAETVLFNLARGSSLAGVTGITDGTAVNADGEKLTIIHPLITCSREEIDAYINENNIPYVDDETNFSDSYTRNYMRINVLPAIEKVIPEVKKAVFRFSRLAAEDEEFIRSEVKRRRLVKYIDGVVFIKPCVKPLFSRAAVEAVKEFFGKKDYTSAHIDNLFNLLHAENGKKFEFLGLTAYKESGGVCICPNDTERENQSAFFYDYMRGNSHIFGGQLLKFEVKDAKNQTKKGKILKFDLSEIPETAVIRFMKTGDKFTKFGGGTKSLGDFFTDKKIPVRLRNKIPLIAVGNEILVVCGVEISEKVKLTDKTDMVCTVVYSHKNYR